MVSILTRGSCVMPGGRCDAGMRRWIPLRAPLILLRQMMIGRRGLSVDFPERRGRGGLEIVATRIQIGERAVIGTLTPRLFRVHRRVRIVQTNRIVVSFARESRAGITLLLLLLLSVFIMRRGMTLRTAASQAVIQVLVHEVSPFVMQQINSRLFAIRLTQC